MTDTLENTVSESPSASRPRAWWQWLFMYPALGVAVVAAIPTAITSVKSIMLDVNYEDVAHASKQNELFMNNMDCLKKDPSSLTLRDNTEIQAAICETGAIWIKVTTVNAQKGFTWINPSDLISKKLASIALLHGAFAGSLPITPVADSRVLCVFKDRSGKVIRRISDAAGKCHDEQIDPYKGTVTTVSANCSCPK